MADLPADPIAAARRMPVQTAPANGREVFVVDRADRPLAGADVFVVDLGAFPPAVRKAFDHAFGELAWLAMAVRGGLHYRTDERGRVAVAMPPEAACGALHPEHDGVARLRLGSRMRIEEVPSVVPVDVVDPDGPPVAGVMLHWVGVRPRPQGAASDTDSVLATAVTDRDGHATLRLFAWVPASKHRVRAILLGGGEPVVLAPVRGDVAPRVQLRVPAYGTLRMPFRDEAGQPLAVDWAWLSEAADELPPAELQRDVAVFTPIPLGSEFVAHVQQLAVRSSVLQLPMEPLARGGVTEQPFELRTSEGIVVGRLVDGQGAPLAGEVRLEPLGNGGVPGRGAREAECLADAGGRFRWQAPASWWRGVEFRLSLQSGERRLGTVLRAQTGDPGPVDVGAIVLQPPVPVAHGRLLDPTGRPIARSLVEVKILDGARWLHDATDADGVFEVTDFEVPAGSALEVHAQPAGRFASRKIDATVGDRDLSLVVDPLVASVVRLRSPMLFEQALAADWIQGDHLLETLPFADGRASHAVVPGKYDIRLRIAGQHVAWIPGVEVTAGRDATPNEIDWLPLVPHATVRVLGANGEAVFTTARWLLRTTDVHGQLWPGPCTIPCLPGTRLRILHPEHRTEEFTIDGRAGVQDLVLRPRAQLRLQVPAGLRLPTGVACQAFAGKQSLGHCIWAANGENPLCVDGDGEVTLRLYVGKQALFEQRASLPEHGEPHDVVLAIDAAVVEAVAAALQADPGR